jgi:hypothetical protein
LFNVKAHLLDCERQPSKFEDTWLQIIVASEVFFDKMTTDLGYGVQVSANQTLW